MTLHLEDAYEDIEREIPNPHMRGYVCIDQEAWRPNFERNLFNLEKHVYHNESKLLVQNQHPSWTEEQILAEAEIQFNTSAE